MFAFVSEGVGYEGLGMIEMDFSKVNKMKQIALG